jgi:putative ABC transport system substrate-binding protein
MRLSPARRAFLQGSLALAGLGLLGGCALVPPGPPQPVRRARIGLLTAAALGGTPEFAAFLDQLGALGYVSGKTVEIDFRFGSREAIATAAAELVSTGVDVLVAERNQVIRGALDASGAVPIVMVATGDPVRAGFVASMARPSGKVTGVTALGPELAGKRLQLLRDSIPGLSRVGVLWAAEEGEAAFDLAEVQFEAQKLGLAVVPFEVRSATDVVLAFAAAGTGGLGGMLLVSQGTPALRSLAIRQAVENRLPVIYATRDAVAASGLMAYGPDLSALFRRAADYVDRILKGAKPADLPVEQPTKFDFAINLKTAQSLGLTFPRSVLDQATEIIQ